ncbi:MAG: hypothetical protein HYZ53_19805 [Planctomycetes bacterium]|nr:hypothetical protein [Planctomycetota bacterium]
MPDPKDLLLARLAVRRGLLTREQVDDCLREQRRLKSVGQPPRALGVLLLNRKYLTDENLAQLFDAQQEALRNLHEFADKRQADLNLAKELVRRRIVTPDQVNECLRDQLEEIEQGNKVRLCALLALRRYATQKQLNEAIIDQERAAQASSAAGAAAAPGAAGKAGADAPPKPAPTAKPDRVESGAYRIMVDPAAARVEVQDRSLPPPADMEEEAERTECLPAFPASLGFPAVKPDASPGDHAPTELETRRPTRVSGLHGIPSFPTPRLTGPGKPHAEVPTEIPLRRPPPAHPGEAPTDRPRVVVPPTTPSTPARPTGPAATPGSTGPAPRSGIHPTKLGPGRGANPADPPAAAAPPKAPAAPAVPPRILPPPAAPRAPAAAPVESEAPPPPVKKPQRPPPKPPGPPPRA